MRKKEPCPVCGSTEVRIVPGSQPMSIKGDRKCQSCETQWALPVPKWTTGCLLALFAVLLVGAVVFLIAAAISRQWGFLLFCVLAVGALCKGIISSIRVLKSEAGEKKIVYRGTPKE